MKIVVAPNALKGSLSAEAAASALAAGALRAAPHAEVRELPLADGGDGTRDVIARALGAELRAVAVQDALGRPLSASFGWLERDKTAIIDVASASGLALLAPEELDPLRASSYGTGELLAAALDTGARRVLVGVGGSATIDGGLGLLGALGARFFNARGELLGPDGAALSELHRVDVSGITAAARSCEIVVLCDVDNPLAGARGAAQAFGAQKGATPSQRAELDRALIALGGLLRDTTARDVAELPGAGAAGGIPAALAALFGARLVRGIDYILDMLDFERVAAGAELLITAEGRVDRQSLENKAPFGAARRARTLGVPTLVLAGSIADDFDVSASPFCAALSIQRGPATLAESQQHAAAWLTAAGEQALRTYLTGRNAARDVITSP